MNALLEWIISNTVIAIFLGIAATTATRFAQRPALAHVLWLLALVKMITPPLFQIPISIEAPDKAEAALVAVHSARKTVKQSSIENLGTIEQSANPADSSVSFAWKNLFVAIWIAGSLLWFALAVWRAWCFNRWLREAKPISPGLDETVRSVARRLGLAKLPRVALFDSIASPFLWSFGGRAWIAFPAKLMSSLSSEEQETLIAHELAHYRRADHWYRWLEATLIGVYWWHPVIWWLRKGLRQSEEDCCDAWVLFAYPSREKHYARTLLKTIDFLADDADPIPNTACGISGRGKANNVKQRFEMILNKKTSPRMTWRHATIAFILATVLMPISGIVLETRLQAKESTKLSSENEAVPSDSVTIAERLANKLEEMMEKLIENRSSDLAPDTKANYKYEYSKRELNLERLKNELELTNSEERILLMRFEKLKESAELKYKALDQIFEEGKIGKPELNSAKLALDLAELDYAEKQVYYDRRIRQLNAEIKVQELELKHLKEMLSKPDIF